MLRTHLLGGKERAQHKKRNLLAANCSILGNRRRGRNAWPNYAQTRKSCLKVNYQVREHKNGNFQEKLKIPKIWAFYGTRAHLKVPQNRFDLGNFFSCSNRSVEEYC